MMKPNKQGIILVLLAALILLSPICRAEDDYYTVKNQKTGETIFRTAMEVSKGDYYITEQNKKYKVVEVKGQAAQAKFEEQVKLLPEGQLETALAQGLIAKKEKKEVGLYHTHSDESYKPSSGKESEPEGGDIHEVSEALAKSMRKKGIKVHYDDANHTPHDGGAYERSRRTALKLVRKGPDALLDIHRDGVPKASEYVTEVNGEKTARIRLVVGRQNPKMKVNSKFAKYLKAAADKTYPGLMKGILYAKGKYNQDLSPRSVILEFGTHVIPKKLAINSTDMVATAVDKILYGAPAAKEKEAENRGAFSSILPILLVALIGGGLLLVANEGSLSAALERIKNFTNNTE